MDTTRLRVRPPCTRNQRPAASLDTVRHEQRSSEKRGHIYRTGLLTEGTHEAHRFPCCFNETLSLAEHAATYKGQCPWCTAGCGLGGSPVNDLGIRMPLYRSPRGRERMTLAGAQAAASTRRSSGRTFALWQCR